MGLNGLARGESCIAARAVWWSSAK